VPLLSAALRFPLGHPAVASVVQGARSSQQVVANVEAFRRPVPAALWSDLKAEGLLRPDAPVPSQT
jgi:D-threo-aldose 1-dehydrogenase